MTGPVSVRIAPALRDDLVEFLADAGYSAAPSGEDAVSVDLAAVLDKEEARADLEGRLEIFSREHAEARPEILG